MQDSAHVAAIKDKEVDGNELFMTNNVHRNGDRDASQRELDQLQSRYELLLADRDKQIQALQRDYNEVISLQLPKIEQNGTAEFPSVEFSDLNTDTDLIASSPNLQVIHHQLLSSRSRAEMAEHKLLEKVSYISYLHLFCFYDLGSFFHSSLSLCDDVFIRLRAHLAGMRSFLYDPWFFRLGSVLFVFSGTCLAKSFRRS